MAIVNERSSQLYISLKSTYYLYSEIGNTKTLLAKYFVSSQTPWQWDGWMDG